MNGVIYARYSAGPGQTDQSIDGQLRDCREYAAKNNITIIDTYIDRHISGTDFKNRTEFNRLMNDCKKHQFSAVIVWKIDRFGRNREELAMNKVKLKKQGVKLLYAKEHIPDGPEGIILESLLEGMAEYYSAELAQKVSRGLLESVEKGHVLGANPLFGYDMHDKQYFINPTTMPIVVEVFERYAAGDTAKVIMDDLNRRGYRTMKGNNFNENAVYYMLRNRKYIGEYLYKGKVYPNVPQIVSNDLFERVQDILGLNSRNKSRTRCTAPVEFLLTGKVFCGYCKNTVIGDSGTGRSETYYYYKCSGRKNKGACCQLKTYRKEFLEKYVAQYTINNVLKSDLIELLVCKIVELQNADDETILLRNLNKRRREVQKSLDNIMKAIEMGIITDTTKDRLVELESQRSDLDAEIAKAEIKKPDITAEQARYWLYTFKNGDIEDVEFCTKLINTFVNSLYLYDDYIVIVYNFCDREGTPDEVKAALEEIKIDHELTNLNDSDVHGQVPATGIEPVRSVRIAGF